MPPLHYLYPQNISKIIHTSNRKSCFFEFVFFSQRRNLTSTEFTLSARWCGDVGVVVDLELTNSPLEGTISKGNESFYQPTNHQFSGNICESAWGITFTYHFSGDICESSWGNHISLKADVCVCVNLKILVMYVGVLPLLDSSCNMFNSSKLIQ